WDEIIDRVRRRLSKWKMKMLSIGGRLALLKSVLGSMPIFHMSLFKVPSGEKLKERFPRVFALDACKEITVGSKLEQPNITFSFRRPPRGGVEQSQTDELNTLMQNVSLTPMQDRRIWKLNASGDFSVAS
nr:RNA-directed DNA polymerase, eukaryota, reverse transcriptase zinc-binding domain protein [Tanacetum cinerariifolium]